MKKYWFLLMLAFGGLFVTGCKDDDTPPEEEEEEVITDVVLTFTNAADATDIVVATAKDADGEGVQELQVVNGIALSIDKTYNLDITLTNALDPNDIEDITEEVEEEGDAHQFFFEFTNDAFADPTGNGNFDNASDVINYVDQDENGHNVGLKTLWKAGTNAIDNGSFRIRLQHQPDIKTATTTVNDGDTDIDLSFDLTIQ